MGCIEGDQGASTRRGLEHPVKHIQPLVIKLGLAAESSQCEQGASQ